MKVFIDDGTSTTLETKGDGVQSLAAIGLLRGLSEHGRNTILALEEPESHLHPGAIHRLRDVVFELSAKHQVVLTTHCPLFVDRVRPSTNIIVSDNKARPASSVQEIRELLGVRASDNLRHATFVLLVEGTSDCIALAPILSMCSSKLASAIRSGTLVIQPLFGASKLSGKVSELHLSLCNVHAYLDHDDEGRRAGDVAIQESQLKHHEIHYVTCNGMSQSELEDVFAADVYGEIVATKYGISLQHKQFRGNEKWAHRMRNVFLSQGKTWNPKVAEEVKSTVASSVAEAVARKLADVLIPQKRNSIDALVAALDLRLSMAAG